MIEINHVGSAYRYRICPTDARLIERKPNKRGGRWQLFRLCATAEEATAALLNLNTDTEKGAGHDTHQRIRRPSRLSG